jgi:hypothetical protein
MDIIGTSSHFPVDFWSRESRIANAILKIATRAISRQSMSDSGGSNGVNKSHFTITFSVRKNLIKIKSKRYRNMMVKKMPFSCLKLGLK